MVDRDLVSGRWRSRSARSGKTGELLRETAAAGRRGFSKAPRARYHPGPIVSSEVID